MTARKITHPSDRIKEARTYPEAIAAYLLALEFEQRESARDAAEDGLPPMSWDGEIATANRALAIYHEEVDAAMERALARMRQDPAMESLADALETSDYEMLAF